jgi:hypothetical protein
MIVAAIDPGIKNLGFCIADISIDVSGNRIKDILVWENYNLVSEGSTQKTTRCRTCGGPASWSAVVEIETHLLCKKCVKKGYRGLIPIDSEVLKTVDALRIFCDSLGWEKTKSRTKASLLHDISKKYLMPFKAPKVKSVSSDVIFKSIEKFVRDRAVDLAKTTEIRIENQKSIAPLLRDIQMQLYSLMRYILEKEHGWTGCMVFVHPGTKNKGDGITAGADGYKDRKEAVLGRIQKKLDIWFSTEPLRSSNWKALWLSVNKKYDMSDTLHMCLA